MTALYTVAFVIASLKNVPALGYRIALRNGRLIFAQRPGVLVVTETWDWRTKLGLRRSAPPSWRWYTARGQSVMVGWDSTRYTVVWKKRIKGGASPAIPRTCDRRDLFIVCLRDRATGRCFVVIGVHTAPVPTKKAPDMVRTALQAHAHAADTIEVQADSTGYPVLCGGDWNVPDLIPRADLRVGPGITHAECFDGTNAHVSHGDVSTFALHSDHPGVRVDLELVS